MIIIGITGTLGAGKGTIVDYLVEEKGFTHYSVRGYLTGEIEKRGLPVNRDSMVLVANDLRSHHSPAYMAEVLYEKAVISGNNCIIESIRTAGEIISLRSKGSFYLFAVDADPQLRYSRISTRASETDHITFETFLDNEKREMESKDPNHQNLHKCIELADFVFDNNSTKEVLYQQVEVVLNNILK
ncbi:MAG: AAA family ATPase [Bacteroidetes bacterium]|nr:AAA family ATPase [Bacteroidota bacterium]